MNMLMNMRSINQTSLKTCCKDCGAFHTRHAKRMKRAVKRSEKQRWMSDLRNYS